MGKFRFNLCGHTLDSLKKLAQVASATSKFVFTWNLALPCGLILNSAHTLKNYALLFFHHAHGLHIAESYFCWLVAVIAQNQVQLLKKFRRVNLKQEIKLARRASFDFCFEFTSLNLFGHCTRSRCDYKSIIPLKLPKLSKYFTLRSWH